MPYLFLILALLLGGCSSKEIYTLGDTSRIPQGTLSSTEVIAIETIKVPTYLKDSPIYIKATPNHLIELDDAKWINSMETQLTQSLINYLQKVQNNPNVYTYPWENIHKPLDKKVTLTITSFIAYHNEVVLEGNYQISAPQLDHSESHLFSLCEPLSKKDSEIVVQGMEKAFFRLASEINSKL
ncbi:MAG TPA: membrane integrity-associated transporter subunit PqiC [Campylobacterales bacterium]|nr:membrane integrity-associated transporter subunit PqiC [Campylobacterales bacterium]